MDFVSVEELNQRIEDEFTGVCVYDVTSSEVIRDFQNIVDKCTHIGWISVKDEMPPEDETVLAWNKEGFPMIDVWRGKMWTYALTVGEISHWMPIPTLPESGEIRK